MGIIKPHHGLLLHFGHICYYKIKPIGDLGLGFLVLWDFLIYFFQFVWSGIDLASIFYGSHVGKLGDKLLGGQIIITKHRSCVICGGREQKLK